MPYNDYQKLAYIEKKGLPTGKPKPTQWKLVWNDGRIIKQGIAYCGCVAERKKYIAPLGKYKKIDFRIIALKPTV